MERTTRKGGTRNAPGWRFDAGEVRRSSAATTARLLEVLDDVVLGSLAVIPLAAPDANVCGLRDEGTDHLMPVVLAPSLTIPVLDGRPVMSDSQSIVLVDRFHPMKRRIVVTFVPAKA